MVFAPEFCRSYTCLLGHSSQIQSVLNLLKAAVDHAHYDDYHLLVDVEFPLVSHEKILRFFLRNHGKEFIGFDKNQGRENESNITISGKRSSSNGSCRNKSYG